MMGRLVLFVSWASLLVVALFCAYYTEKLQYVDRNVLATVKMVNGKVFHRPANYSVYEIVRERDNVFDGDYISTGAGAKTEVQLLNSKTIFIGENSLVQLSFGVGADGLGSDIVTLLKGDVSSKAETRLAGRKSSKNISFKVGRSSLRNIESTADVEISKKLDQAEASIRVVAGSAQIIDDDNVIKDVEKDQVVILSAAKAQTVRTTDKKMAALDVPVNVPVIKAQPQKIAVNDSRIMTVPTNLSAVKFAARVIVEESELSDSQVVNVPGVSKNPASRTIRKVERKTKKSAVRKVAVAEKRKPFDLFLFESRPDVFVGSGIYFVKNQTLYAKVSGSPTQSDLLSIAKKLDAAFFFEGNAEAFVRDVEKHGLSKVTVVYAVGKNGVQKIDAQLLRSRPAAIDLLRSQGYSIFDENINVISVGH